MSKKSIVCEAQSRQAAWQMYRMIQEHIQKDIRKIPKTMCKQIGGKQVFGYCVIRSKDLVNNIREFMMRSGKYKGKGPSWYLKNVFRKRGSR